MLHPEAVTDSGPGLRWGGGGGAGGDLTQKPGSNGLLLFFSISRVTWIQFGYVVKVESLQNEYYN